MVLLVAELLVVESRVAAWVGGFGVGGRLLWSCCSGGSVGVSVDLAVVLVLCRSASVLLQWVGFVGASLGRLPGQRVRCWSLRSESVPGGAVRRGSLLCGRCYVRGRCRWAGGRSMWKRDGGGVVCYRREQRLPVEVNCELRRV